MTDVSLATGACIKYQKEIVAVFVSGLHASLLTKITFFIYPIQLACSCNKHGSAREDCDQMTGRCVCKQGLQGMKCNICPDDTILDSTGCIHGKA